VSVVYFSRKSRFLLEKSPILAKKTQKKHIFAVEKRRKAPEMLLILTADLGAFQWRS
jgi:hypothetical protein